MSPENDSRPLLPLDASEDQPLGLLTFVAIVILIASLASCFAWAFFGAFTGAFFTNDDTVIIGVSGDRWSDRFPASSIATNNLAPDGGGMSPKNGEASGAQVVFSADRWSSDGDSSGVSNGALVLFRYAPATTQVNPNPEGILFVTQFDSSSFTAATRLNLPDSGLAAVTSRH